MSNLRGIQNDVAKLCKKAEKGGFQVLLERGSGHIRVENPQGQVVAQCSKNPGSGKAITNFRCKLRRAGLAV